jgi:hypothetical protein
MNGPTDVINSESSNPLQTAIAAGMFLAAPRSVSFESRKVAYVLVPQADGSGKIEYVDQPEAPLRATGTYTFDLVESFVEFLNAHKDASTTIYTRRLDYGPQVHHLFNATAIINEHEKDLGAQFRDFRALLHPPFSESFKVWMGSNGKAFDGNVAFAEFLEDHLDEIVEPEGAKIMELALNFAVKGEVAFSNPVNLADGSQRLSIARNNTPVNDVVIPKRFVIEIPVLRDDEATYKFDAHFRFRLNDGGLKIWYQFIRPDRVLHEVFSEAMALIRSETSLPTLAGSADFTL